MYLANYFQGVSMNFDKIESFQIDHENLFSGLYLSRKDSFLNQTATTFDLRLVAPNREDALDGAAMHTIEHIGATYLRNSARKDEIIYFGPMGCRTGFYLVLFGDLTSYEVFDLVVETFTYIANFNGEIPGATKKECGNYSYQDLSLAKKYAKKYVVDLISYKRLEYN